MSSLEDFPPLPQTPAPLPQTPVRPPNCVEAIAHILKDCSVDEETKFLRIDDLADMCSKGAQPWKRNQEMAHQLGLLPLVCDLTLHASCEEGKVSGFHALSQLCTWNTVNANFVGKNRAYFDAVEQALIPGQGDESKWALVSMCNVLMHSFESHNSLLQLVQPLVTLWEQERACQTEICITMYNFSLNESSRRCLVEKGVVDRLLGIYRQSVLDLAGVGVEAGVVSAMAVANCQSDEASAEPLSLSESEHLMQLVCDCFLAALQGRDFPAGSDVFFCSWEVAMALRNLTKSEVNATALLRFGADKMLHQALIQAHDAKSDMSTGEDSNLVHWCLETMWHIADCAAHDEEHSPCSLFE